jgi:site-specific recombinase XerD
LTVDQPVHTPHTWLIVAPHVRHGLAEDGATATEIQALLGHGSLNTSQGYIDATANATRQAARANRTYRALERLTPSGR